MLKLTVKSTQLIDRSVPTKKGTQWEFKEQETWGEVNGEYRRVMVRAQGEKGKERAYPVGEYTVGDASFVVSERGQLGFAFDLVLEPLRAAAQKLG